MAFDNIFLKFTISVMLRFVRPPSPEPPLSKKAATPEPEPKHPNTRASRLEARRARAERDLRLFNLLKAGVPVAEVALQEGLSLKHTRALIREALARRALDPPAGFAQLQIGRLSDALMVAHAAMMEGDLHALDRVVRIVGQLDRYHGFARTPADPAAAAAPALPASAPPRALPAPAEMPKNRVAKD
jgi:hypothetical protein